MSPSSTAATTALQSGAGINLGARVNWLSPPPSPANDFPLSQAYTARPRPKDMKLLIRHRQGNAWKCGFGTHLNFIARPRKSTFFLAVSKLFCALVVDER